MEVKEVTLGLDTGSFPRDYLGRSSFPSKDRCFLTKEREGWKFSATLVVGLTDRSFGLVER